jgi:TorA maturation chaperone TorD
MAETVKLSSEEITELNDLRTKSSELTFQRGQLGIAEDNIKRQLNQLAEKFNELFEMENKISQQLFESYGKGEINLEEGTFVKAED